MWRQVDPDGSAWSTAEHLLANIFDVLQGANWQRGGGKGRRPQRIPRPGDTPAKTKIGKTVMTIEEYERLRARPRVATNGEKEEVI